MSHFDYHPEKVRHTKLRDHVKAIRARHEAGESCYRIAKDYGVHEKSVSQVCEGISYPNG